MLSIMKGYVAEYRNTIYRTDNGYKVLWIRVPALISVLAIALTKTGKLSIKVEQSCQS